MLVMDKSSLSELFLHPRPLYLGDFANSSPPSVSQSLHPSAIFHWAKLWSEHQAQQAVLYNKLSPQCSPPTPQRSPHPLGLNLSLLSPPRKLGKLSPSAFSPVHRNGGKLSSPRSICQLSPRIGVPTASSHDTDDEQGLDLSTKSGPISPSDFLPGRKRPICSTPQSALKTLASSSFKGTKSSRVS